MCHCQRDKTITHAIFLTEVIHMVQWPEVCLDNWRFRDRSSLSQALSYQRLKKLVLSQALSYQRLKKLVLSQALSYQRLKKLVLSQALSYQRLKKLVLSQVLSHQCLNKLVLSRLYCRGTGVTGSELGPVSPVSVYFGLAR